MRAFWAPTKIFMFREGKQPTLMVAALTELKLFFPKENPEKITAKLRLGIFK